MPPALLGSLATLGGLSQAPATLVTLLPLLAVGITYFRYQSVDPESPPVDAVNVIYNHISHKHVLFSKF